MFNKDDMMLENYKRAWEVTDEKRCFLEDHLVRLCHGIDKAMSNLSPDSPAYQELRNALVDARVELTYPSSTTKDATVIPGVKHMGEEIREPKQVSKDLGKGKN